MVQLSGLNVDYSALSVELQEKMANESNILSVGFPDQTTVLLANTLAGITAMLNYSQLTANLNNFTPFAFLKKAGYAISATLGVAPRRRTAASMDIMITPADDSPDFSGQMDASVIISEYTRFLCRNRIWHTRESYQLNPEDSSLNLRVYEGNTFSEKFTGSGEKYQRYFVGNRYEIDNNTVRVMVDFSFWEEGRGSFVFYPQASQIFLQQTAPDGKVLVFFGNGLYGSIPPVNTEIEIFYTTTSGFSGNAASSGDAVQLLDLILVGPGQGLNIFGITMSPASGGEDEENLDDIKYVSPRLYAAAHRAVRRDDYIGHLLGERCPIVFADARPWGEYEQANREGIGKLEMMNRAYWTGVLRTLGRVEMLDATTINDFDTEYVIQLEAVSMIPGSLELTNNLNTAKFNDRDGNGVLVSDDVVFQAISGGTLLSSSEAPGFAVEKLLDGDILTFWQSSNPPTPTNVHFIFYDFGDGNGKIIKSYRLKSANKSSREERAFPRKISLWGSNAPEPGFQDDVDWYPLRGIVELNDPGVSSYSPWITLDNDVSYRWLKFKIFDRWGSQNYTRITELQAQSIEDTSTVDYATMAVQLKVPNGLFTEDGVMSATFYGPDVDSTQQSEIDEFLKGLNHFTTLITYKSPIMKRVELEIEVYYYSEFDENRVFAEVEHRLNDLFSVKKGSIGKRTSHSDLTKAIIGTGGTGVDYSVIVAPELGGDLNVDHGQFLFLTNSKINMYLSDRST